MVSSQRERPQNRKSADIFSGADFRQARESRLLSRSQFAEQLTISAGYLRGIERNKDKPSRRVCAILKDILYPGRYRDLEEKRAADADPDFSLDARRALKMSQRQFAQQLGVSKATIAAVETSRRRVSGNLRNAINALKATILPTKRACGYILDGPEYQVHLDSCEKCLSSP